MDSNWVSNLDMLAASGVIDFDAPAYLLDKPARYVGNPQPETLPMENPSLLPEGVKLKDLPSVDEYNQSGASKSLNNNPSWKKWTFGAIAAGLIGTGIYALSKGKLKLSGLKNIDMSKIKTSASKICAKTLEYIKKPFVWIASKFKKS